MIVHAVSIHTGGGKVLLDHLLTEGTWGEISHLLCDERYVPPPHKHPHVIFHKIKPTLLSRWKAEWMLKQIARENEGEVVLCFSNLPPAFRIKNRVVLYLQNALLLPGIPLYTDSVKAGCRMLYEKCWLNVFWKNADEVWVQTSWMKKLLESKRSLPVQLHPLEVKLPSTASREKTYDYITVSGSAPHKRLLDLIAAWGQARPSASLLIVSDEPTPKIKEELKKIQDQNVTLVSHASREEVFRYYEMSQCLIVTSKIESYCLPIYEALHFGLKVMAPNEDYVQDVKDRLEIIEDFSVLALVKKLQGRP